MLALSEVDARRCSGCGGDLTETTVHEAWDVPPPLQCHRCEHIILSQEPYVHDFPKVLSTFRWTATRRG